MNLKVKTLHELLTLSLWLNTNPAFDKHGDVINLPPKDPRFLNEVNEEIALRLKGDTYQLNIEENDNTTIGVPRSEE